MGRKISTIAILIFVLLTIIWGTSFILIKKSLMVFSPIQVGSLRILITFLALLPFSIKHFLKVSKKDLFYLGLSGIIGSFLPAFLFAFAQEGINSSTAGILNSLTPLFALLVGVLFFKFQAKWWNYMGIFITFVGTYGLLSISGNESFGFNFKYGSYIILASIGYGTQVNLIKYRLQHLPSFTIVVMQFFIISLPAAFILFFMTDFTQIADLSTEFLNGLMYVGILAIIATALALVLFYRLVKLVDPVFSASVTYFIPAVATLWGVIDGEFIEVGFFIWVSIILGGVYLINSKSLLKSPLKL